MISLFRLSQLIILCVPLAITGIERAWAGAAEDAAAAYSKKDYSRALELWRPLAEEGNAEAQRGLGILYDNGLGIARDPQQAVDSFRKAAAQGDAEAEYRLGQKLVQGSNVVPRDTAQGLALLTKAGEQG